MTRPRFLSLTNQTLGLMYAPPFVLMPLFWDCRSRRTQTTIPKITTFKAIWGAFREKVGFLLPPILIDSYMGFSINFSNKIFASLISSLVIQTERLINSSCIRDNFSLSSYSFFNNWAYCLIFFISQSVLILITVYNSFLIFAS